MTLGILVHPGLLGPVRAQGSGGTWVNTYGSGSAVDTEPGGATSVQQTSDGGFVFVGFTTLGAGFTNVWVLRLDHDGSVVWENAYGGTGNDFADSVAQTSDGGFIVAGRTCPFGPGGCDAWVLRLDGDGNVVWENAYGGTGTGIDQANSVVQTSDGGFIVAGFTCSFGAGNCDAWVLRLDGDGNVVWENAYGGTGLDQANSVVQTSDGGFIVAGSTHSFGISGRDVWVLRLDGDGNIVWENAYGLGGFAVGAAVQETTDNGFIVAGFNFGGPQSGAWALRLDGDGNVEWQKIYSRFNIPGPDCFDFANSVAETSDGGFVLAGGCDATILNVDSDGNVEWLNEYGGGGKEFFSASSVQPTSDGGFIVAGAIFSGGSSQAWAAKLDSDGLVGSGCSFVTPVSAVSESDTSATIIPTSSTITDTSTLDTLTPTSSIVTDTSSADTVTSVC